jgi:hypothetical protein
MGSASRRGLAARAGLAGCMGHGPASEQHGRRVSLRGAYGVGLTQAAPTDEVGLALGAAREGQLQQHVVHQAQHLRARRNDDASSRKAPLAVALNRLARDAVLQHGHARPSTPSRPIASHQPSRLHLRVHQRVRHVHAAARAGACEREGWAMRSIQAAMPYTHMYIFMYMCV